MIFRLEGEKPLGTRTVTLEKGPDGLGFSIVGGRQGLRGNFPVFVKTVFKSGAAADGAELKCGDRIFAVNGISMEGLSHSEVVAVLKKSRGVVRLTVA